ncbi:ATP-binding protein [Streptomyces sp. NPDC005794]|uniref:ATP-binding protein n=1 Tax=Streptomyces sp. NPDC005794 TaxID=3364733 RepID=UPI0036A52906
MTSKKPPLPVRPARTAHTAHTARARFAWHDFTMRFSSTPRGARLARRLAGERLDAWGIPYGSDAHDALTLAVAELSSNAVRHGHVSGRDFRLRLCAEGTAIRIEVTDTRGDRLPSPAETVPTDHDGGRGCSWSPPDALPRSCRRVGPRVSSNPVVSRHRI